MAYDHLAFCLRPELVLNHCWQQSYGFIPEYNRSKVFGINIHEQRLDHTWANNDPQTLNWLVDRLNRTHNDCVQTEDALAVMSVAKWAGRMLQNVDSKLWNIEQNLLCLQRLDPNTPRFQVFLAVTMTPACQLYPHLSRERAEKSN